MKPANVGVFEVFEAPDVRADSGIGGRAKKALAAIKSFLAVRNIPDHLPARLRRDAGIDELELECRRIVRAPIIR